MNKIHNLFIPETDSGLDLVSFKSMIKNNCWLAVNWNNLRKREELCWAKENLDTTYSDQFTESRTWNFLEIRKKYHFKAITLRDEMIQLEFSCQSLNSRFLWTFCCAARFQSILETYHSSHCLSFIDNAIKTIFSHNVFENDSIGNCMSFVKLILNFQLYYTGSACNFLMFILV